MRIGVTGVTGFVGQRVAQQAEAEGMEVVGFSRSPKRPVPHTVEMRSYGAADLRGLDGVIHLAGESILGVWTAEKKRKIRESRITGTRMLVNALDKLPLEERPKVLVGASAVGYYGDRGDELLSEEAEPGTGFLAEVSRGWEAETQRAEPSGIRVVRGRIGVVLGAGGGSAAVFQRIFGTGLGGKLGSGKQWMSWVGLDDLARMLIFAVRETKLEGAVNLTAPAAVRNEDLTRVIGSVLKRPAVIPVPGFALKLALREMSEMLLASQRVDPAALRGSGFRWEQGDLEATLRAAFGRD